MLFTRVSLLSKLPHYFKHLADLPAQHGKINHQQGFLRIDHDVDRRLKLRPIQANRFPQTPPHTIALHRPTQKLAHRKTDAQPARCLAPPKKRRQMWAEMAPSLLVNPLEV